MPQIRCTRFLSAPAARSGTGLRRLMRRPAPMLALALMAAAMGCREDATAPTSPKEAAAPALATAATTALAFYQVSGGYHFTCGLATDNRAYCWGYNVQGQVGDGTTTERRTPVLVAGTLRFRQVSAGAISGCGVTTDFRAYCWGANDNGLLGDGTTTYHPAPVPVAGGHRFRQVETNWKHTCGVSYPDDRAYCWGENVDGELGDGTRTNRLRPVAVAGGLLFRRVSAGWNHTCGVTTDNRVFCWGLNNYGQIGDSSTAARRLTPSRVARTRQWHDVDAGAYHTCAVTTSDRAWCWGNGRRGELGNGQAYLSFWPRAVAGGLSFHRVSAGYSHTCGESTGDRTYCWGDGSLGQLGAGFINYPPRPVAVAGGLAFKQVSTGSTHTCGKTAAGVAYCWGYNAYGQLGDGTTTNRFIPVAVAGAVTVVADGFLRQGSGVLDGSVIQVLHVPSLNDRGIIEFQISNVSDPVAQATLKLSVYGSHGPYPFTIDVFAYPADGVLSFDDWDRGTLLTSFEYTGAATVTLDVTAPLQALVSSGARFAGFNLRFSVPSTISLNGPFVAFNSTELGPAPVLDVTMGTGGP